MSEQTRERFAAVVRDPRGDVAEAALLCCAEVEPDIDIDAELLRLDALADGLRTTGYRLGDARSDAEALRDHLGGTLGFAGDPVTYHDPANALLTHVLDRRRGLPIALAIVYIAIGQRVGVRAFGINTPGHFLVGVADPSGAPPVVLDPFAGGALLDDAELQERIRSATAGLGAFHPSMLSPTPTPVIIRRLLNNLTRDFLAEGDTEDALWTVELKRLLPDTGIDDARALGEILVHLGRYRWAAEVLEEFPGDEDLRRLAIRARAKMN